MEQNKKSRKCIHTRQGAISANKLLKRVADECYITEWTELLAKEVDENKDSNEKALLLFRLGDEWFGLLAKFLLEVCEERPVHRLPHRLNSDLKGLVNLKGQLRICVDMHQILDVEKSVPKEDNTLVYNRLLSMQKDNQIWIFPVDEVYGIQHFDMQEMKNVPVTVSKSAANFLRGVVPWNGANVSYLDEELLFSNLKRSIL